MTDDALYFRTMAAIVITGQRARKLQQVYRIHITLSEATLRLHVIAMITSTQQKHSHLPRSCLKVICHDKYPLINQCCEPPLTF